MNSISEQQIIIGLWLAVILFFGGDSCLKYSRSSESHTAQLYAERLTGEDCQVMAHQWALPSQTDLKCGDKRLTVKCEYANFSDDVCHENN